MQQFMPENPVLVESIVSTDMAKSNRKAYDVELVEVPSTGFGILVSRC